MFKMLSVEILRLCVVCIYLSLMSYQDIKYKEIYLRDAINLNILMFILYLLKPYSLISLFTGVLIVLFMFIISKISKQTLGCGDLYILISLVFSKGENIINILLFSFLIIMIYSLILIIYKKNINREVAYIPFIFMGYLIQVMYELF